MAHIVFSFPVLIMLSSLYVLFAAVFMLRNVPDYRRKQQQLHLHTPNFSAILFFVCACVRVTENVEALKCSIFILQ